ncbi:MAG TPA: hypothetical protein VLH56_02800, partial [Dissulfurispiraceae bacterium]|nr:hypothetical protein [Dissulfurispiraceae bacterium]
MTKIRPYRAEDYPAIVRLCEECSVEPIQAYALASGIALIYERSGRIIGTVSAIYQGGKAYADNLIVLGNSPHVANSLLEHLMTLLRFV